MQRHFGRAAWVGCEAGLFAALCVGALAVGGAVAGSKDWYFPFELAGGLVTGSSARLDAGLQTSIALVGGMVHLAIGAGWGGLFGLFAAVFLLDDLPSQGLSWRETLWIGAFFGIVVWVLDLFVFMPRLDPAAARAIPLWFGALANVAYGALVGVWFPSLRRASEARAHRPGAMGMSHGH